MVKRVYYTPGYRLPRKLKKRWKNECRKSLLMAFGPMRQRDYSYRLHWIPGLGWTVTRYFNRRQYERAK